MTTRLTPDDPTVSATADIGIDGDGDQSATESRDGSCDIQCLFGSNHPDVVAALTNQGDVAHDEGRRDEAGMYYRHAAAEAQRILGPAHAATRAARAKVESNLGR